MHGRAWLMGFAVAALAASGCVSAPPSNPAGSEDSLPLSRSEAPTAEAATADPARELPLDWFVRLQGEIGQRESGLYFGFMERCMAEAGFEWEAPKLPPASAEWEEIIRYPVRYGVVTLVQAEQAGYGDPEEAFLGASPEEADDEGLPSDPAELEAFQTAWFGATEEAPLEDLVIVNDPVTGEPVLAFDPSSPQGGGCLGGANAWLEGGAPVAGEIDVTADVSFARTWVDLRIRAAFNEALADNRVEAVAAEWRGCMAERGWELEEWWFPGGLGLGGPGPVPGTDEEAAAELEPSDDEAGDRERAIDDIRCQDEVEWLVSLRAVEAEYQQETVERVPDLFAEVRDLIAAYSARLAVLRLEDLDG